MQSSVAGVKHCVLAQEIGEHFCTTAFGDDENGSGFGKASRGCLVTTYTNITLSGSSIVWLNEALLVSLTRQVPVNDQSGLPRYPAHLPGTYPRVDSVRTLYQPKT